MGDLTEDWAEAQRVINAYADACVEVVNARWYFCESTGDMAAVVEAEAAEEAARIEMEETIRALIDPRSTA